MKETLEYLKFENKRIPYIKMDITFEVTKIELAHAAADVLCTQPFIDRNMILSQVRVNLHSFGQQFGQGYNILMRQPHMDHAEKHVKVFFPEIYEELENEPD